jgi:hypothetical protein
LYDTYDELTREELQKLLDRKHKKVHPRLTEWENRPGSRMSEKNRRIDSMGETTDEIEAIIKQILKVRD